MQCDGTQAPSLVMLYVQNSRDKARRGDIPRLARHAEMMVAVYAKLLDPSFVSLSSFFLVFEVVDGRGRDAMAHTELYRVFGDTLHVGPRWRIHCGGLSVRGWRFHSAHSSTQRRLGRGSQSEGMSLEFGRIRVAVVVVLPIIDRQMHMIIN